MSKIVPNADHSAHIIYVNLDTDGGTLRQHEPLIGWARRWDLSRRHAWRPPAEAGLTQRQIEDAQRTFPKPKEYMTPVGLSAYSGRPFVLVTAVGVWAIEPPPPDPAAVDGDDDLGTPIVSEHDTVDDAVEYVVDLLQDEAEEAAARELI